MVKPGERKKPNKGGNVIEINQFDIIYTGVSQSVQMGEIFRAWDFLSPSIINSNFIFVPKGKGSKTCMKVFQITIQNMVIR